MRSRIRFILLLGLLVCGGCGKQKSTAQLIVDLKSSEERDRIIAARLLPERESDAAQVVPALTEALKDNAGDVRWSAAIGLGYFGEKANEAIPALQTAQHDRDPRVREAAGVALSRIDPDQFQVPIKPIKRRPKPGRPAAVAPNTTTCLRRSKENRGKVPLSPFCLPDC
jgi:HEAT repeat protein